MKSYRHALLAGAVLFATSAALPNIQAQTINYGSSYLQTVELLTSNGGSQFAGGFTWQLGYFDTGFTPNSTNYSLWADNWNSVASTTPGIDDNATPGDTSDDWYFVTGSSPSPVPNDAVGKQAYVFAFNNLGLIGTASGEALLYSQGGVTFTNELVPPTSFDIANSPSADDDVFNVIWGRVNRNTDGSEIVGSNGIFTFNPGANFEAQTGSFVPEPGSLLLGLAGVGLMLRRRRAK